MRIDPSHVAALQALYAETDALFTSWACPGAAECCQFAITGEEPQIWPIEWSVLERAIRANPAGRDAAAAGDCPAFDASSRRCRAYSSRPFGCRTHFCDRAEPGGKNPRSRIRELARRLAALAEASAPGSRLLPLRTWMRKRR